MKKTITSVVILLILISPICSAAGKVDLAQVKSDQEMFINVAKAAIKDCNMAFQRYRAMEFAADKLWESEYDVNESEARFDNKPVVAPTRMQTEPYHLNCARDQKMNVLPQSKTFINSFKAASVKAEAKALIAQWITALDSIGTNIAENENAKFQTIANSIYIDMQ